ncbi:T9SS type A sorting domain-containing protein [Bizionia sp. KMM 8389]
MKKALLCLSAFVVITCYAQSPITNFFSIPMSSYAIVEASPDLNQTAAGAGLVWNFTNLNALGTNVDTYTSPTSSELTTYPGTTTVLNVSMGGLISSKIFAKDVGGVLSLTGATMSDIVLNYNSDNASLGAFPKSFGASNSDALSGSFTGMGISGTFSGTIQTTVDAHGTLNMNDIGQGAYSASVTRLKMVQNLSITYILPNIGSIVQTSYFYYENSTGNLVFRSNNINISVPIASISDNITVYESFLTNPLSVESHVNPVTDIILYPNPVSDMLYLQFNKSNPVTSIRIFDTNGRLVLQNIGALKALDVSKLQSGLYTVAMQTESGQITKKFLKK